MNKEATLNEYLENKYNQKFIINTEIEGVDRDVYLYAYNISPVDNSKIHFVAGKKKEKHLFPLIPPSRNQVFFDNYFDEAKQCIVGEIIPQEPFSIYSYDDISDLSTTIYTLMEKINIRLDELGFSTTKYTCSINICIYVNQEATNINFYVLDKSIIYDLLYINLGARNTF